MTPEQDREYCAAFALECQIPQFRQLPGDIQRGLVDIVIRIGCVDFACMYYMRQHIDAERWDAVGAYLVQLNKQ